MKIKTYTSKTQNNKFMLNIKHFGCTYLGSYKRSTLGQAFHTSPQPRSPP